MEGYRRFEQVRRVRAYLGDSLTKFLGDESRLRRGRLGCGRARRRLVPSLLERAHLTCARARHGT